jgi:hypothetical protein
MAFVCSICGETATQICARCTKDTCGNHLCEKCLKCSDCCECEIVLGEPVRSSSHAAPVTTAPPETVVEAQPQAAAPSEPASGDADPDDLVPESNLGAAG